MERIQEGRPTRQNPMRVRLAPGECSALSGEPAIDPPTCIAGAR